MEENKYYIPETSDFYEGFQYEILINTYSPPNFTLSRSEWVKESFDDLTSEENYRLNRILSDKAIRVPYLTKEDIESEGWEEIGHRTYKKETKRGNLIFTNCIGHEFFSDISRERDTTDPKCLFSGQIRCKNDLKLIMKLLNIN